jgi:hypothetical protein
MILIKREWILRTVFAALVILAPKEQRTQDFGGEEQISTRIFDISSWLRMK